jgi:hypothetical protein
MDESNVLCFLTSKQHCLFDGNHRRHHVLLGLGHYQNYYRHLNSSRHDDAAYPVSLDTA